MVASIQLMFKSKSGSRDGINPLWWDVLLISAQREITALDIAQLTLFSFTTKFFTNTLYREHASYKMFHNLMKNITKKLLKAPILNIVVQNSPLFGRCIDIYITSVYHVICDFLPHSTSMLCIWIILFILAFIRIMSK